MRYVWIAVFTLFLGNALAQTAITDEISTVRNYHKVTDTIATGGMIYDGGLKELKQNGFATIIDLRTPPEGTEIEKQLAESSGLAYFNLPVSGSNISKEQVIEFASSLASAPKPVLIHCASGNRVGAMWSLYKIAQGKTAEEAFSEGRSIGMRSSVEELLRKENADECSSC